MKPWWKSKTLRLAILQILGGIIGWITSTMDPSTSAVLALSGVMHGANRFWTRDPVI